MKDRCRLCGLLFSFLKEDIILKGGLNSNHMKSHDILCFLSFVYFWSSRKPKRPKITWCRTVMDEPVKIRLDMLLFCCCLAASTNINGVDKVIEISASITKYSSTDLQTLASKMTTHLNQHLSKTVLTIQFYSVLFHIFIQKSSHCIFHIEQF